MPVASKAASTMSRPNATTSPESSRPPNRAVWMSWTRKSAVNRRLMIAVNHHGLRSKVTSAATFTTMIHGVTERRPAFLGILSDLAAGYPCVSSVPTLTATVADAGRAVDFYKSAFGAVEPERLVGDVGVLHDEFTVEGGHRSRLKAGALPAGRADGWRTILTPTATGLEVVHGRPGTEGSDSFRRPSVVWSSSP
jgi:hypothetical protein